MAETPSKNSLMLARVIEASRIDLVLDVGGNEGQYGERLRRAGYPGRIVSFEPLPSVRETLAAKARALPPWDLAPPLALSDEPGRAVLHVSAESDMSSILDYAPGMGDLLDSARYTGSVEVETTRLDRIFDVYSPSGARVLLKIDTQGTEARVLDGAAGVLDRVDLVQLELSLVPVYAGETSWRVMVDRLEALGFEPVLFIPGYFNRKLARLVGMDGVFRRTGTATAHP